MRPGKPDARAGYGIVFPHQKDYNVFRKLEGPTQTNNRAELTAFIDANYIIDETLDPERKLKKIFYTDCMLLAGMIQGGIQRRNIFGWKKTSNTDLLKRIGEIVKENGSRLTVIHIYSHTGGNDWKSKWNDEADKLAKMGADLHGQHYNGSISDLISNGPVLTPRGYSRPQVCMIRPIVRRSFARYGT
jgi:ribonuclease HI